MSNIRRISTRLTPRRLRIGLLVSFILLAVPLGILSVNAWQQIKWEALFQQRSQAEEFSRRIDQAILTIIQREDARPVKDYGFLAVAGVQANGFLQRSPLSAWPVTDAPPGLIGYFQVDDNGQLQTPLLPGDQDSARWGLTATEVNERRRRIAQLHQILSQNQLVPRSTTPETAALNAQDDSEAAGRATSADSLSEEAASQQQRFAVLDELQRQAVPQNSLGNIGELQLEKSLPKPQAKAKEAAVSAVKGKDAAEAYAKRAPRKEQVALPAAAAPVADADETTLPSTPVRLFESEVDALQWVRLDSGQLLFYRKVWQNGARLVQGLLVDEAAFFAGLIAEPFRQMTLADHCNLVLAYRGEVLRIFTGDRQTSRYDMLNIASARDVRGTLILQQRLSNPLGDLQLIFSAQTLPQGTAGNLIIRISLLLFLLLVVIFGILYRVGLRQIRLAQQQQDFIASVSHELKTPLTSIRMFAEMLKEGWASPAKQQEYYTFICDESERLSRLIANVLQLARMERQDMQLDIKPQRLNTLCDLIRSRIQSQVDRAGYALRFTCCDHADTVELAVDADALIQILLNLVDNAIKFSRNADIKVIELTVQLQEQQAAFVVRDFGPGIPPGQQRKIFDLFYRVGNELTRETQGTGIGLALVYQLVRAMHGSISVRNVSPGAEFTLHLPTQIK